MLKKVTFSDGTIVDIDLSEFEPDGIGTVIDNLTVKHGGVVSIE